MLCVLRKCRRGPCEGGQVLMQEGPCERGQVLTGGYRASCTREREEQG